MLVKFICLDVSNNIHINNHADYIRLTLCEVINLSMPFLQAYQNQFASFSPFISDLKIKAKS